MVKGRFYDVIFLDVRLPDLDGLQTCLVIKEISPATVVVMMTGYRQEASELMERALQSNAYTCLYKPLDMTEVLRLLEEIERG
jgi:DNA-binding response OmpR family regulator